MGREYAGYSIPNGYREATTQEVMDYLNGYISGNHFIESEHGLIVREK